MERIGADGRLDAIGRQGGDHRVAVHRLIEEHDIRLVRVRSSIGRDRRSDGLPAKQPLVVPARDASPIGQEVVQAPQLGHADGGQDVAHAVVEAGGLEPEAAALAHAAVAAQEADASGELVVRGGDHAALAGRDRLARVEAEAAGQTDAAGLLPPDGRAQRARSVLDDGQAVRIGHAHDSIHVGRQAERMDRHDGLRQRRDACLQVSRIERESLEVDIHQDRHRALLHDGLAETIAWYLGR